MLFLSSADLFQNELFQRILSGTLSECQTAWIKSRTDILSVLIWVQTVCKGYQQTTKVTASLERVNEEADHSLFPNMAYIFLFPVFDTLSPRNNCPCFPVPLQTPVVGSSVLFAVCTHHSVKILCSYFLKGNQASR